MDRPAVDASIKDVQGLHSRLMQGTTRPRLHANTCTAATLRRTHTPFSLYSLRSLAGVVHVFYGSAIGQVGAQLSPARRLSWYGPRHQQRSALLNGPPQWSLTSFVVMHQPVDPHSPKPPQEFTGEQAKNAILYSFRDFYLVRAYHPSSLNRRGYSPRVALIGLTPVIRRR
jgi:hypothetical protein